MAWYLATKLRLGQELYPSPVYQSIASYRYADGTDASDKVYMKMNNQCSMDTVPKEHPQKDEFT